MIQSWAEDSDTEFVTEIDNIIGLGETRLIRDLNLEIFNGISTGNFVTGNQNITKPTDSLAIKSLFFTDTDGDEKYLERKSDDYLTFYWKDASTTGTPKYVSEKDETTLRVVPTPNTTFAWTLSYVKRPTGLSSTTAETFLSKFVGDLLFKACIIESEEYLKEDPSEAGRIAVFERDYLSRLPAARQEFMRMQQSDYKPGTSSTAPIQ